jgi:hypothetical protein
VVGWGLGGRQSCGVERRRGRVGDRNLGRRIGESVGRPSPLVGGNEAPGSRGAGQEVRSGGAGFLPREAGGVSARDPHNWGDFLRRASFSLPGQASRGLISP